MISGLVPRLVKLCSHEANPGTIAAILPRGGHSNTCRT